MVGRSAYSMKSSMVQLKKTTPLCLIVVVFVSTLFSLQLIAVVSEDVIESPKEWTIRGALASLDDSNQNVRILGIKKLCKLGELKEIGLDDVKQIALILKNAENSKMKCDIIRLMGNLGIFGKKYQAMIVDFLDDEWFLRVEAIRALSNLSKYCGKCIRKLETLINDPDFYVRSVVVEELSKHGKISQNHLPHILPLFASKYESIRRRAVRALQSLPELPEEYVLPIIAKLKDESPEVRKAAAKVLETFEKLTCIHIKKIAHFLSHEFLYYRIDSLITMRKLERLAEPYINKIINLLDDPHVSVRTHAIITLGELGRLSNAAVPRLGVFLTGNDECCRTNAIIALGKIGNIPQEYINSIETFLNSDNIDLCSVAVEALGNIGKISNDCGNKIAALLFEESMTVRISAIKAIGKLSELATEKINFIVSLLEDENSNVQAATIRMLADLGPLPDKYVPNVVDFLSENYQDYRYCSEKILLNQRELELEEIVQILNIAYNDSSYTADIRFLLYLLGGNGRKDVEIILKWFCQSNYPTKLSYTEAKTTISVFNAIWNASEKFKNVRSDVETQVVVLTTKKGIRWKLDDLQILKTHYDNLKSVGSIHADILNKVISELENPDKMWTYLKLILLVLLTHMSICIVLIILYPRFSVLRKGLWNPQIRRWVGWGYMNFALARISIIRKRLLEPYYQSFIADAIGYELKEEAYFKDWKVIDDVSKAIKNINDAIPCIDKQIVLEGESGLVKPMFLKFMISKSRQCPIYFKARDCNEGIIQAIEKKIKDISKKRETLSPNFGSSFWGVILNIFVRLIYREDSFLKKMICRGYIEIYIEGMDEISQSDQKKFWSFLEEFSKVNIIIITQPIDCEYPPQIRVFKLQPLKNVVP